VVRWCSSPGVSGDGGVGLTEQLQQADIWARTTVYNQIIEHLELLDRSRGVAHDLLVLFLLAGLYSSGTGTLEGIPPAPVHLIDEDLPAGLLDSLAFPASLLRRPRRFLGSDRAVHGAREAHAEVDADPVVDDFVHGSFVLGEIKVGEEAKRPKGKREHRRDDFLAAVSANGSKDLQ
jgi:hypothetical protein